MNSKERVYAALNFKKRIGCRGLYGLVREQ